MATGTAAGPSTGESRRDDPVAALRHAGDHPLMYSFPRGAVFSFDRDLRYLSMGGLGLADVGLSRELLEGRTIFEAFPEATAAAIEPHYRAALAGVSTSWDVAYGGRVFAQRLAPVTDSSGQVVAGLGFTQDVTEERLAEVALRESEQRNRLTFDNAPIGIAIVELDGTLRQVNAALADLLGYTADQLQMMTFRDVTHPDDLDLDERHVARLLAGEIASYQIEKRYITASGEVVWGLLSGALARDERGLPLYLIGQVQDTTESRRQHQALQNLTAMLAHDVRTPAAVILGFAELLGGPAGSDAQRVENYAARISAAARAMTDLLDNALVSAEIDSGGLVASPRRVSLRASVATALQTATLEKASVDTSAVDDVHAWVDPVHLGQVLANLLTNATKYGGGHVSVSTTSTRDRVCLSIADDGPGVEPDFVPHLFDRFSRSTVARGGPQRGSGLGLYIVRDLLAANGATIHYAAARTGGADFTIDLPTDDG